MSALVLCRVCLTDNVRMHSTGFQKYQESYVKIAGENLVSGDGIPETVCYLCAAHLQRFYRFWNMSQNAEKYLMELLQHSIKLTSDTVASLDKLSIHHLTTTTKVTDISDDATYDCLYNEADTQQTMKEEPLDRECKDEVVLKKLFTEDDFASENFDDDSEVSQNSNMDRSQIELNTSCSLCSLHFTSIDKLNDHRLNTHDLDTQYDTTTCEETFGDKLDLRNQKTIHTGEKLFICDQCHTKFNSNSNLQLHIRRVHNGEEFSSVCDVCHKTFIDARALKRHSLVHAEKKHECDSCDKKFYLKCSLTEHMRTHTGEKPYECDICGSKFKRLNHLKYHTISFHTDKTPFSCRICSLKFKQKANLRQHNRRVHGGEYACDKCMLKFNNGTALSQHMVLHSGETCSEEEVFEIPEQKLKNQCQTCNRSFNTRNKLNMHIMRLHTGEFPCKICKKMFNTKTNLKSHQMSAHSEDFSDGTSTNKNYVDDDFICNVCNKKFKFKSRLKTHMMTHSGEKPFTCNRCDIKFITNSKLQMHIKKDHTGEVNPICYVCNRVLSSKSNLKIHMRIHTGERPFPCDKCNTTYISNSNLQIHIRKEHTEMANDKTTCDICNKKFTAKGHLKIHMRIHTGNRPFACELCDKKCLTNSNLQLHIRRAHKGESFTSECTICNKKCVNSRALERHMSVHTGIKPFTCKICNKGLIDKRNLRLHMQRHAGEKPYACEECDKRFLENHSLITHMRTHTGEKPFACDRCGSTFKQRNHLKYHMISFHTSEKPFLCDLCNVSFKHKSNLRSHNKRLHRGERIFNCDQCDLKFFDTREELKAHMVSHTEEQN